MCHRRILFPSSKCPCLEPIDLLPLSNKEILPARRPSIRFRSFAPDKQEQHLLQVYYQPINQKDIFYPGNVPIKSSDKKQQALAATSCPDLIQSYVYEESATSIESSDDDDDDDSIRDHHRLFFYRKGLSFLHTLRRMLGLQLFRDYRYVLIFFSQFLFYLFYDLVYLFPGKTRAALRRTSLISLPLFQSTTVKP